MYRLTAAALLIGFYIIYYGKQFLQKRAGITTNQLSAQSAGQTHAIALWMGIATLLAPLGEAAAILFNVTALPDWARITGLCLAGAGDLIFLISVTTMGSSWRAGVSADEHTALVTRGIYSISRNPAFLGFDLVYIGILLAFFSWWLCLLSAFAVIMLHLQIVRVEEPFLPEAFGDAYLQYRDHVCRYLGRKK